MTNSLGIYIHIPFCEKKCNYCSFYSVKPESFVSEYVLKIINELEKWGGRTARPIDTLYIGGGTPSLLSPENLKEIILAVRKNFNLKSYAEITVEINPKSNSKDFLVAAKEVGVNRISVGVQSSSPEELKTLGRRHTFLEAKNTILTAREVGFKNISADIMIGLPNSNNKTLEQSINDILNLNTEHISAYILKVEEGTPFYENGTPLPSDDTVSDQYLQMVKAFKKAGFNHYEISNFAKKGFESKHNNRYWLCSEYIGIGPSAHSFFEGKRFYYPADILGFLNNPETVADGEGGDEQEFIMLALRLSRGLKFSEFKNRFDHEINQKFINKARFFEKNGLCRVDADSVSLTTRGMLLSNTVILELLGECYEDI